MPRNAALDGLPDDVRRRRRPYRLPWSPKCSPPSSLPTGSAWSKIFLKSEADNRHVAFLPAGPFVALFAHTNGIGDGIRVTHASRSMLTRFSSRAWVTMMMRRFANPTRSPQPSQHQHLRSCRCLATFRVDAPYDPRGDQPEAIARITSNVDRGQKFSLLKGATGTGKTFVMANVIAETNRPTMVLCHNKTLVSQVARELRMYLPNNVVEMFFSYYDVYRPEAFIEASNTYISKRATIKVGSYDRAPRTPRPLR